MIAGRRARARRRAGAEIIQAAFGVAELAHGADGAFPVGVVGDGAAEAVCDDGDAGLGVGKVLRLVIKREAFAYALVGVAGADAAGGDEDGREGVAGMVAGGQVNPDELGFEGIGGGEFEFVAVDVVGEVDGVGEGWEIGVVGGIGFGGGLLRGSWRGWCEGDGEEGDDEARAGEEDEDGGEAGVAAAVEWMRGGMGHGGVR